MCLGCGACDASQPAAGEVFGPPAGEGCEEFLGEAGEQLAGKARERAASDSVQELIDAVTGATWGTRNRIMADMFQKDLADDPEGLPTFAPPGQDVF